MTDLNPLQTQPERLAHAADLLEAVLLGGPDPRIRIMIARAIAILSDVHPPYAPGPEITEEISVRQGVDLAIAELKAAIQESDSVEDAIRAGLAGRALHPLRREP